MKEFKRKMHSILKLMSVICLIAAPCISTTYAKSQPIALDSRIKTYIYNENEVFRLVVHYGYQTSVEFAEGEEIQTISAGNSYAWQLTPIGRRLFIKPLEDNILTNMTILTNKRAYQMEVQSKMQSSSVDEELVYVVRFFYPEDDFDQQRPEIRAKEVAPIPVVRPFNFNYTMTGSDAIAPVKIFDDGINTFFKFHERMNGLPKFEALIDGKYIEQVPRKKGEYIVLNTVASEVKLSFNKQVVLVFNDAQNIKAD